MTSDNQYKALIVFILSVKIDAGTLEFICNGMMCSELNVVTFCFLRTYHDKFFLVIHFLRFFEVCIISPFSLSSL